MIFLEGDVYSLHKRERGKRWGGGETSKIKREGSDQLAARLGPVCSNLILILI